MRAKSLGKVISVSICFECKLASSGCAYPFNIAEFFCIGKKDIVNLVSWCIVDCFICKFYTVIELLTRR